MLLPFCPCFIKCLAKSSRSWRSTWSTQVLVQKALNDASVGRGAEGVQGTVIARHAGDDWMAHLEGR
jgi:hypothetical protein